MYFVLVFSFFHYSNLIQFDVFVCCPLADLHPTCFRSDTGRPCSTAAEAPFVQNVNKEFLNVIAFLPFTQFDL